VTACVVRILADQSVDIARPPLGHAGHNAEFVGVDEGASQASDEGGAAKIGHGGLYLNPPDKDLGALRGREDDDPSLGPDPALAADGA
jgi:hypothetical protein